MRERKTMNLVPIMDMLLISPEIKQNIAELPIIILYMSSKITDCHKYN